MNHNNTFFLIILSFIFAMHDSFSAQLTLEEEKKIIEFQEKFQNEDVSVWFLEIYNYWLLALGKENYNYIAQKLYASLFSEIKNRINLIELSAKKNMLSSSTIQEEKLKAAYRDDDKIILEGTDENFLFPKNKTILLSNVKKLVPFLLLTCFPKKALTILNEEDIVRDSTNLVNSSIDNKKRLIIQLLKDAMKEKKINSYLDTNIEYIEHDEWDKIFSKEAIFPEYTYLKLFLNTAFNLEKYENNATGITEDMIHNIKLGREVYTFFTKEPIFKKNKIVNYNAVLKIALVISAAMLLVKRKSIGNFFYSDIPSYLFEKLVTRY